MSGLESGLVILSEVLLSAYPLLIKRIDMSVVFQTGLRLFVFTVLAALIGTVPPSDVLASTETVAMGGTYLLHIISSYTAFNLLSAGNAMALFYTYPLWNILGTSLLLGEQLDLTSLPWIGVALTGALALAHPTATNWSLGGVVMALTAALTETAVYLWFKSHPDKEENKDLAPWTKMIQMFGGAGLLWVLLVVAATVAGLTTAHMFRSSPSGLAAILGFNALIGFGGYALRLYMIPKVSTVLFSSLSFFGIVSAYLYGWIGANEWPTRVQMAGAAAIVLANLVLVARSR
jgi:drug/metabolite transporter (DMT)-like permease